MSYYDKYLKYKNKYLQYKNSLELNMQGGGTPNYPPSAVNTKLNDIFYINNLTATPNNNDHLPNSYRHNNILSIEKLSDTPKMSEFAGGGAYKRKIKSKYEQEKLLKLLETNTSKYHKGSGEDKFIQDCQKTQHKITDIKTHRYFPTDSSSSSTSSDDMGI